MSQEPVTFVNPVYPKSFPDPFVLKHRGQYYGYCTGFADGGLVFGVITSRDLVTWSDVGGAMEPIVDAPPFYWAPEVSYDNGKFYLYYSAGNETLMHLRVAVSDRPDGGFADSGRVLTSEEFAIDAHVFTDDDGSRYMFYATDFLEHTHVGTGTVVDRMIDWFTLEGQPRPVTRAKYDWQVYDPQRHSKGGVRWHTVEGPAVLKRKGRYFEMFSGGNWQNTTYGVSFATSGTVVGEREWEQYADGHTVLPILRTLPGSVTGPGHNSIVRGPNNRELYCVYHSWVGDERVEAIDRMDFAGDRIFVVGPTFTPQPRPYRPTVSDLFAGEELNAAASSTGRWVTGERGLESSASDTCERVYHTGGYFLCEFTFKCLEWKSETASFGFGVAGDGGNGVDFRILPSTRTGLIVARLNGEESHESFFLPLDFILSADHLMRIESDGCILKASIDGSSLSFTTPCPFAVHSIGVRSQKTALQVAALTITDGFEDCFDAEAADPLASGWTAGGSHESQPKIAEREMVLATAAECFVVKGRADGDLELAANLRFIGEPTEDGEVGIQLIGDDGETLVKFGINARSQASVRFGEKDAGGSLELPAHIPARHHQLRLVRIGGVFTAMADDVTVASFEVDLPAVSASVYCRSSAAGVDMVRLTTI